MDAVNFGVIPIVYEYEGTTLESLLSRLDLCLQGRSAKYDVAVWLTFQIQEVIKGRGGGSVMI